MPILQTQFPQLFQLSTETATRLAMLNKLTDMSYDEFATEFEQLVRVSSLDVESESDFAVGGFGLPQLADGELGALNYDEQGRWFPQTYVPQTFNLGFVISHNMQANDKWGLANQRGKWLARSFRRLPEVYVARMFSEGFAATTQVGQGNLGRRSPDGRPLFDTAHPMPGGGGLTQSNTNADGGADLTHASVQAMAIRMASRTDDRGMPVHLDMKKLVVPKALYHRALEINKSSFRTDTDKRVMNVLNMAMPFEPVQNHYLVDPSAYFGVADLSRTGLRFLWRERPNRNMWTDPATRAIHVGIWCQFDFGWSHFFGVDGDPGNGA